MPELFAPTIQDQITEVKRELKMRESAFPHFIAKKQLSQVEADRRNERLRAALASLEKIRDGALTQPW